MKSRDVPINQYWLCFPGQIEEEGSTCSYNADAGSYTVYICKTMHGEMFKNLDLLTALLNKKSNNERKPLIEVINHRIDLPDVEKNFSVNWIKNDCIDTVSSYGFGFANKQHNISARETLCELLSLDDPSKTAASDRRLLRMKSEEEKFDSDHYLADLYEDDVVAQVLNYHPWWNDICDVILDKRDKEIMQCLPNKEYLLDEIETKMVFIGLVDILFGYAYNIRATQGEDNVESSWTIRTLSSTLCYCDTASNIIDQLVTSYRRILCYPQFRSWKVAEKLRSDVTEILKQGRRCVLKCLLQTREIFRATDTAPCYLLNDLYLDDYCVWIQNELRCDATLASLAHVIESVKILKSDVGFELVLVEKAAALVLEEQDSDLNSGSLVNDLNSLTI